MQGEFGIYAGTNPKVVSSVLKIVAAGEGGRTSVIMIMRAPQHEWQVSRSDLAQIEQSLSAGGSQMAIQPVPANAPRASLGLSRRDMTNPEATLNDAMRDGIVDG